MNALNKICFYTLAVSFVLLRSENSFAKVCVTGMKPGSSSSLEFSQYAAMDFGEDARIYQASLTCQDLQGFKNGLRAMMYTFNMTRLAQACGPAGIPVAVGMFSVGAVLYTVDLVVNMLPCEDKTKDETENLMKKEICQALRDQGVACDPSKMIRN